MTETIEYQAFPRIFGVNPLANPQAANGNTGDIPCEGISDLAVVVDVTAITGSSTPTLTITIQMLDSTSGKYVNLISTTPFTTTGTQMLQVARGVMKKFRLAWTISGSFTGGQGFTFTLGTTMRWD